jgi:hypothetical protein
MRIHGFIQIKSPVNTVKLNLHGFITAPASQFGLAPAQRAGGSLLARSSDEDHEGLQLELHLSGPGFPGEFGGGDFVCNCSCKPTKPQSNEFFNIRKQLRLKSQHSDLNSARNWKCAALGLFDSELP